MDALRLLFILSIIISSSSSSAVNGGDKVSFEIYYESLCPYCSNLIVNYLPKLFETDLISITDFKLIPYGNAKIKPNGTIVCQVSVGLYYESLCPYSASFIVESLSTVFDKGLISIVDLSLVPWGNAKLFGDHTFKCQHGEYECLLNTVEACAIDVWPDWKDYFPFVYCVESLVYHHNYTYWETCFVKLGLDPKPVTDCYTGERGKQLELEYAAETNALEPPHRYVPWVVVNGQPLYDDYREFVSYICNAYKGPAKPSACTEASVGGIRKMIYSPYGEETSNSKLFRTIRAIISWFQRSRVVASL